jgi:hypothetical protein
MFGTEYTSTTVGSSFSTRSATAITNSNANLCTVTLNKGMYLVSGRIRYYSGGGYLIYLGLAINSVYVTQDLPYYSNTDDCASLPMVPIKINTDGTTVSLRGRAGSEITTTYNAHEIFAIRVAGA